MTQRQTPGVTVAEDLEALSQAACEFWLQCAQAAVAERGRFVVALTGGSTPRRLYELLAAPPLQRRSDWSRCHAFWGDERMVPPDGANSNYQLAHGALLTHVPIPAVQIHRIPTEGGDAATVASLYEEDLRGFFGLAPGEWPRFDLILLGMGSDGHVASLFPGNPSLDERRRLVVGSPAGTLPPHVPRVTLTLPVLNAARAIAFLVSGAEKAPALGGVLAGNEDLPAARVRPSAGELRWFVDLAAAGSSAP